LTPVCNLLRTRGFAHGRLLRLRLCVLREAALQGLHQIDDLGGSAIARGVVTSPFVFALDQLAQCVLIALSEARRVERTRSAFDDPSVIVVYILGGLGVDELSCRTIAGLGIELIDPDVLRLGARRTIEQVTSDKRTNVPR
jgi:hypothetical protein